jgi:acetylglutamate kinase
VLVHGGGKAITDKMRVAGLKAKFVNGLRVTDEKAIRIVEETLDREINPRITATINHFGGKAVGISGRRVFKAQKMAAVAEGKNKGMDYGFIGDVTGVNLDEVQATVAQESVPVISPISQDANGVVLNVNADLAAGAIAGALKASKLIYLSDVLGIMRNPAEKDSLIPSVNREEIRKLIDDEVIEGGMIPKVQSAVRAIDAGVSKVHFIDGRLAHSLLLEIFTNSGIGTEIIA